MTKVQVFMLIGTVIIVAGLLMYHALKNAPEVEEPTPKFQPRKTTYVTSDSADKPKKKKHYRNYKKKKPVENVEKRPVGRPKKVN